MNFSRYPNARADIFRTCSKSVLDPPGPFLPSKLVLQSLPGSKAGETIKAFSLNGSIDEDLKAAADRLKRQRKPVAQTLGANSVGGGRLKAAKGKGKRAKAKTATTQKLSTDADSIVEVAADAAHAQAYPQSPSEALEGGRKKRGERGEGEEEGEEEQSARSRGGARQRRSITSSSSSAKGNKKQQQQQQQQQQRQKDTNARIVRSGHHRHSERSSAASSAASLRPHRQDRAAASSSSSSSSSSSGFSRKLSRPGEGHGGFGPDAYSVRLDQIYDALSDA